MKNKGWKNYSKIVAITVGFLVTASFGFKIIEKNSLNSNPKSKKSISEKKDILI